MQISFNLPWTRGNTPTIDVPSVEDTKRALSDGADTVGSVAQDIGNQAATFGREAIRVGRDAAKMSREAARKGQLFAATSGDTLRKVRTDAAAVAEDLRHIRVVRENRRGPSWKPGAALLAGAGAGLAAMFFLDPEQGRRRRIMFMDQVQKWGRLSSEWLDGAAKDLRNRSHGLAYEARKAADSIRAKDEYDEDVEISATPNVADELAKTDWPKPAAPDALAH